MSEIYSNTISNFREYFLFRHWKDHTEITKAFSYSSKEALSIKKIAEKTIYSDLIDEFIYHTEELKKDFILLGLPTEILDSIKKDIMDKMAESFKKRTRVDKRCAPESEEDNKHIDNETEVSTKQMKHKREPKRKIDSKTKKEGYLNIISEMIDYMPTCIILRSDLKRRIEMPKSRVNSHNKGVYLKDYEYFEDIVENSQKNLIT